MPFTVPRSFYEMIKIDLKKKKEKPFTLESTDWKTKEENSRMWGHDTQGPASRGSKKKNYLVCRLVFEGLRKWEEKLGVKSSLKYQWLWRWKARVWGIKLVVAEREWV